MNFDENVIKNELSADIAFNNKKRNPQRGFLTKHPFDIDFDNVNGGTLDIVLASCIIIYWLLESALQPNYTRDGGLYGIEVSPALCHFNTFTNMSAYEKNTPEIF